MFRGIVTAAFTGTLHVLSLGYAPVVGDSFTVITFDQRMAGSTFDQVTWTGFGSGTVFDATYNINNVTLTVAAVPESETWALWLAGLFGLAAVARRRRRA